MIAIDKKILKKTSNELEERSKRVDSLDSMKDFFQFKENGEFGFDELQTDKVKKYLDKLSDWEIENSPNKKDCLYIYLFELIDDSCTENFKRAYENTLDANPMKKAEGWRAFSKFTKEHNSSLLYVGSSEQISKRISQHLGIKLKDHLKDILSTYALHMAHWLEPHPAGRFNISIYKLSKSVDRVTMQAIEDALWTQYRPCFGKRGAK